MNFEEIRLPVSNRFMEVQDTELVKTVDGDTGYHGGENFHLNYCGREQCDPGHSYGPNKRTAWLIHVIVSGQGVLRLHGKTWYPVHDQAFLIVPNETANYAADEEDPWAYQWLAFSGFGASECVRNMGFTDENRVLSLKCTSRLLECIDAILKAHQLTYANALKRQSEMLRFLSILLDDQKDNPSKMVYDYPSSLYVKQAVGYLVAHYSEPIKINALADYLGVNRCYLSNSFRKQMKVSPQQFLFNTRMEKAVSLLRSSDMSIKQIAEKVGYPDPFAFSKQFKLYSGSSPREYRRKDTEIPPEMKYIDE